MSETFGEVAKRLAAFSARALGWRPSEFWQSTPADLALAASDPEETSEPLTRNQLNQMLEHECHG